MYRSNARRLSVVLALLLATAQGARAAPFPARKDAVNWNEMEARLKRAIMGGQFAAAQSIVTELAETGEEQGFSIIIELALGGHDYDLDRHAGGLLVQVIDPRIRKIAYEAVKRGRNARTTVILLAVLKRWADDPAALETLHAAVAHPRKEVVFTALKWIRELQMPEASVPVLIEELARREKRPHDRVFFDLHKTLTALTDKKFDVAIDWSNYWKARQSGVVSEPKESKGGRTAVYRPPSFFSVVVDSDAALFIIDISFSMNEVDAVVEEPARTDGGKPRGRTGVDPAAGGSDTPPEVVRHIPRIVRVKDELIRTLRGLPQHTRFGILSFSHLLEFFDSPHALIQATDENKERAIQWVAKLKPNGATRTDLALTEAFQVPDVDTIYLLTDGAPRDERNRKIAPESVLFIAKIQNRFRKARIHTIGFAQAGATMRWFVQALAEQNDGKCILLE